MFVKAPDAKLDFAIDWTKWLAAGETITTAVWTMPAGITKESDTLVGAVAVIWLSGGTEATQYDISCEINTTAGRRDERSISVFIEQR